MQFNCDNMIYKKNNVILRGKVQYTGLKLKEYSLHAISVQKQSNGRSCNMIPIYLGDLGINPQLNTFLDIEGKVEVVDDIAFVRATSCKVAKKNKAPYISIELTGVLTFHKKLDTQYVYYINGKIPVYLLPAAAEQAIDGGLTNIKGIYSVAPMYATWELTPENSHILCVKLTNI